MNRDGVTDVGLFVPRSENSSEILVVDWFFLGSMGTPTTGSVSTLNHPFNQMPFGNDRFFTFGDSFTLPLVGNFDPPLVNVDKAPTITVPGAQTATAGVDKAIIGLSVADVDSPSLTV